MINSFVIPLLIVCGLFGAMILLGIFFLLPREARAWAQLSYLYPYFPHHFFPTTQASPKYIDIFLLFF